MYFAIGHIEMLTWIQTGYLKNLKLFSIRVKGLFEPTVFHRKGDGCLLFLKAFSWETNLWVTIVDFVFKKIQNWEGKSVFS